MAFINKPTARGSTRQRLRELRDRQVRIVVDTAIQSGGQVSDEQFAALNRLTRLLELQSAAQPTASVRWAVLAFTSVSLAILSVLIFARVPTTDIELDVSSSGVTFVLSERQKLTDALMLSTFGIDGVREVLVPRALDRDAQRLQPEDGEGALRLSANADGKSSGSVNLEPLILPAQTVVALRHIGLPRRYRLTLGRASPELHVSVLGRTELRMSGVGRQLLDFGKPTEILLRTGSREVALDVAFAASVKDTFAQQVPARQVSFLEVDETANVEHTAVRYVSTILSGKLYFESLNGGPRELRGGEVLQFERADGEFRTVRLEDDRIVLNFHGTVRGMTLGHDRNVRSVMPTWLEWLQARHGLSLFWAAAVYILGLITAAFRWFGKAV